MPHAAPAHKSFADRTSLYQEITDKIIRELEQGRVPWVQPWLGSGAGVTAPLGLPKNAATGRPYSGINILILWLACTERGFTGQNWMTFRQALKLGAHVRKAAVWPQWLGEQPGTVPELKLAAGPLPCQRHDLLAGQRARRQRQE